MWLFGAAPVPKLQPCNATQITQLSKWTAAGRFPGPTRSSSAWCSASTNAHTRCWLLLPSPVSHTYHLVSPRVPRSDVLQELPGPRAVMPPLVLPCPDLPAGQQIWLVLDTMGTWYLEKACSFPCDRSHRPSPQLPCGPRSASGPSIFPIPLTVPLFLPTDQPIHQDMNPPTQPLLIPTPAPDESGAPSRPAQQRHDFALLVWLKMPQPPLTWSSGLQGTPPCRCCLCPPRQPLTPPPAPLNRLQLPPASTGTRFSLTAPPPGPRSTLAPDGPRSRWSRTR